MADRTASQARANLCRLLDQVAETHKPMHITGKRNNGVLISESDWAAIQETLDLLAIPRLRKSLKKGMETPTRKFLKELRW